MTKQTIKDDGREHKYFHILPNMADDDLDPFQYRLYGHYKRKCGENGSCVDSVRQTAKATQMSDKKVQKARDELAELGYITVVKPTYQEARKGQTVHITLNDLWQQNVYRYAKAVVDLPQGSDKPVVKIPQQDTPPIVDLPQAVVNGIQQAVVNLPRLKELKTEDSSKNKKHTPTPKPDLEPQRAAIIELMRVDGYDPAIIKPDDLTRKEQEKYLDAATQLSDSKIPAEEIPALHKTVKAHADANRWSVKVTSATLLKHSGKYIQARAKAKVTALPIATNAAPPPDDGDYIDVNAELAKLNRKRGA